MPSSIFTGGPKYRPLTLLKITVNLEKYVKHEYGNEIRNQSKL